LDLVLPIAVGFFDESTDQDTEGISYTVAGFVSHNQISACLELRWKDLLREFKVEYFKASELEALEGQFRQYRDDPLCKARKLFSDAEKRKQREIKTAFTDLIVDFEEHIYAIGAVVILPEYDLVRAKYPHAEKHLPAPHFLACQLLMVEAGVQCAKYNRDLPSDYQLSVRPIFDSHETYSGRMKQAFDQFCIKNPISSEHLLPLHYEDDKKYLSLQVADNIAFEIRRSVLSADKTRKRISLERLKRTFVCVYKLNYDALKAIADNNNISAAKPMEYTLNDILTERDRAEPRKVDGF
jgi:hypothetical protein